MFVFLSCKLTTVEELVKIIHYKETFFDCQINVVKIEQVFEEMNSQILANQKFFFPGA